MDGKLLQGIVKNKQKILYKSIFKVEHFIADDKLFLKVEFYGMIYFLRQRRLYSINSKNMLAISNKRLQLLRLTSNFKMLFIYMQVIYLCAHKKKKKKKKESFWLWSSKIQIGSYWIARKYKVHFKQEMDSIINATLMIFFFYSHLLEAANENAVHSFKRGMVFSSGTVTTDTMIILNLILLISLQVVKVRLLFFFHLKPWNIHQFSLLPYETPNYVQCHKNMLFLNNYNIILFHCLEFYSLW